MSPTTDTPTTAQTKGSCLCRRITFTLTGQPTNTVLCHCTNCAHASGVGFMANSFYDAAQLHITSPLPSSSSPPPSTSSSISSSLKTYTDRATDSGAVLERQFCGECGSPLFTTSSGFPGVVIVASGSLEGEVGREWVPRVELYCKRRRGWVGEIGWLVT